MTPSFDIVVHGTPAPQGSKRGGVSAKTGKTFVYEQNSKTQKSWRQDVIAAAVEARGDTEQTLDGPVYVAVWFRLPRPASVNVRRWPYPCVKPDIDKLLRNTLDGLKQAGVYRDDAQVVQVQMAKRYATDDPGGAPCATIRLGMVPLPEII